jgi:hypothetical protein
VSRTDTGDVKRLLGRHKHMEYHEFLTYLFDRPQTRELAVELGVAIDEVIERSHPEAIAV